MTGLGFPANRTCPAPLTAGHVEVMPVATSRTGTAVWKRTVAFVVRVARNEGLEHCPSCGVELAWSVSGQPNSVEVDHIVPHSRGGADAPENARVLCRTCNRSRGNRDAPKPAAVQAAAPLRVSRVH